LYIPIFTSSDSKQECKRFWTDWLTDSQQALPEFSLPYRFQIFELWYIFKLFACYLYVTILICILVISQQKIWSVVDLLRPNPHWLSLVISSMYGLDLERRIFDNILYEVDSNDISR
jgi:hypothetical protein